MKTIFKHLYLLCVLSCLGLVISCKNTKMSFSVLESEELDVKVEEEEQKKMKKKMKKKADSNKSKYFQPLK